MDVLGNLIFFIVIVGGLSLWRNKSGRKKSLGRWFDFKRDKTFGDFTSKDYNIPQRTQQINLDAEISEDLFDKRKSDDEDEYKAAETYETEAAPYIEKTEFHDIDHSKAYDDEQEKNELSIVEKGIIFGEILAKPVSMRK